MSTPVSYICSLVDQVALVQVLNYGNLFGQTQVAGLPASLVDIAGFKVFPCYVRSGVQALVPNILWKCRLRLVGLMLEALLVIAISLLKRRLRHPDVLCCTAVVVFDGSNVNHLTTATFTRDGACFSVLTVASSFLLLTLPSQQLLVVCLALYIHNTRRK